VKRFVAGLLITAASVAAAQDRVESMSLRIGGQELALTPAARALPRLTRGNQLI